MPKFVIEYTWDGGDNAESILAVHCLEYESLEKLKGDMNEFCKQLRRNRYNDLFCPVFAGITFHEDIANQPKPFDAPRSEPVILPLDEWFEYRKKITTAFY